MRSKLMIEESRQTAVPRQVMRLMVRDEELADGRELAACVPTDCEQRALYAVLLRPPNNDEGSVVAPSLAACAPAPGETSVAINCAVSFVLPASADTAAAPAAPTAGSLQVCGTKDAVLPGKLAVSEGGQLRWTGSLQPDTVHSAHVSWHGVECHWRFTTAALEPVRILVTDRGQQPAGPTLLKLDRRHGLLAELHARVLARFELSATDVCLRDVASPRGPVATDADVAQLEEFELVTFSTAPAEPAPPSSPPQAFAEYKRTHWVNDSAGFYALCGKMSAEEETAALLDIVRAFAVGGDDRPGSSDAAGARKKARTGPGGAADCGCEAPDPTLTVVPSEMIRPLWGPEADSAPVVFEEAVLHTHAASWLACADEASDQHDLCAARPCLSFLRV